jgi:hypothetical protein
VRLQASSLSSLHLLSNLIYLALVQYVMTERTLFDERNQLVAVERRVDDLLHSFANLGTVAQANGLDQELSKWSVVERQLSQDVEDFAAERLGLPRELLEQSVVDVAFARLMRDQTPEVTHLCLADAVDPAESLFEAIRVPREIVIHHQVRTLQVDALASSVGGDEDQDLRVVLEGGLGFAPFVSVESTVNRNDSLTAAKHAADAFDQVVQRVAMFREDDQLAAISVRVEHFRLLLQEGRELLPLGAQASADLRGHRFEVSQALDFRAELSERSGGRGLVDNALFELFGFGVGTISVLELFDVFLRNACHVRAREAGLRTLALSLLHPLFKAVAPARERVVNRIG